MSSNIPNDKNTPKRALPEPIGDLMKTINEIFNEKPIKGFLQSIDEFFKTPFPFDAGFHVDMHEKDREYVVLAELPGVKKDQIRLNVTGNYLTVSVDNTELQTAEDELNRSYRRRYVNQQSSRTISLPHAINENNIKASYRDGLLQVRIPRETGKSITIED